MLASFYKNVLSTPLLPNLLTCLHMWIVNLNVAHDPPLGLGRNWRVGVIVAYSALAILFTVIRSLAITASSELCIVLNFLSNALTFALTFSSLALPVQLTCGDIPNPHSYWASLIPPRHSGRLGWPPFERGVLLFITSSTSISSSRGSLFNYEACTHVVREQKTSEKHTSSYTIVKWNKK